jgi:hypothetical protein
LASRIAAVDSGVSAPAVSRTTSAISAVRTRAAIAEREAKTRQEKVAAADGLLAATIRQFGSAHMASLWTKQPQEALGGKRQSEYCVDKATVKIASALLPAQTRRRG